MWMFAVAIAGASLVGSLHCVGMCGPFALWATGSNRTAKVVCSYHLGRLTTYLSAGLAGGLIGSTLTISGQFAGFQALAAKLCGSALIIVGVVQLLQRVGWWGARKIDAAGDAKPSRIAQLLQAARPLIASKGPMSRAYLGGLLTTWLPCGWLYVFVLAAAGTGDVLSSLIVMTAFWLGTLPALTGLVYGVNSLAIKFRAAIPVITSLLLIVSGLYTATGRAAADLSSLNASDINAVSNTVESASQVVKELGQQPLPCCVNKH